MKAEHAPLPWRQSSREYPGGFWRAEVYGADGPMVVSVDWTANPEIEGVAGTYCGGGYRGANAEFIVRAANNFDALLAALKAVEAALKEWDMTDTVEECCGAVLRAAIARAEWDL